MKFIKYLLIIIAISACSLNKESPNFIFIYTDDQRFDTIGLISQNEVITPNLDRLAKAVLL
ncbi:MAG: hypothetical protein CM15mP22_0750 [Gammaproteobacteria bacterium]|nr:MAG: hypothetical protein CM15mP22_0750 [Gammaproteobacteria bacterium]